MDTFMDKLASKLNSQEMIRANSAAEARENERLQKEVEVYKQCLQEMKQISLQNTSTADEVAELVKASMDKITAIQVEAGKSDDVLNAMQSNSDAVMGAVRNSSNEMLSAVRNSSDEMQSAVKIYSEKILAGLQAGNDGFKEELKEELKRELIAEIKKEFKGQEEVVHKECVKVYRNVQAVITEENQKQTEEIIAAQSKGGKKATAALVCGILAMAFAALGL
ncbi:MAG: hypothetical protein IJ274_15145, partial [Lachnospiraceae bacterium]|nr:hypothetical protein [Lachnospiraceae bacterium]